MFSVVTTCDFHANEICFIWQILVNYADIFQDLEQHDPYKTIYTLLWKICFNLSLTTCKFLLGSERVLLSI